MGITHDARGNVLSDGTYTYTWDAANRLTGVKLASSGAPVATFAYDSDGMRQTATAGGVTTRFAVDELTDEIMALTDGTGAVVTRFIRDAAGALVAMVKGGAVFTYLTNAHGDVTALVNSAGAVVARWTYDAWGRPTEYDGDWVQMAVGTAGNPFLYAGYFFDTATGLYYLRARYYDPATGRFLSMDPEPGRMSDRLSQNPYIYCQNDPVNLADPSGRATVAGGGGGRPTAWQKVQIAALRAKRAAEAARKAAAARLAAAKRAAEAARKAAAAKLAVGKKAAAAKLTAAKTALANKAAAAKSAVTKIGNAVADVTQKAKGLAQRTKDDPDQAAVVVVKSVGKIGQWVAESEDAQKVLSPGSEMAQNLVAPSVAYAADADAAEVQGSGSGKLTPLFWLQASLDGLGAAATIGATVASYRRQPGLAVLAGTFGLASSVAVACTVQARYDTREIGEAEYQYGMGSAVVGGVGSFLSMIPLPETGTVGTMVRGFSVGMGVGAALPSNLMDFGTWLNCTY